MTNFFDISFKILNDFGEVYPSFEKVFYTNEEVIEHQFNFTIMKQFNEDKISRCICIYLVSEKNSVCTDIKDFYYDFKTFDDFLTYYSSIIFITTFEAINHWTDLFCSCKKFAKNKKCVHVYNFLKMQNKLFIIEINMCSLKKRRGRPKKIPHNISLQK